MSGISLIDLESSDSWPSDLIGFLDHHYELFAGWEAERKRTGAREFDSAIYALLEVLRPYALRGWHCTRLTEQEIQDIRGGGLQLPDRAMLVRRINALVASGIISPEVGQHLIEKNHAEAINRAGMLWFCFYPPGRAGESGIGRFFRYWGGEALYGCHEGDPVTAPTLARIGVPCVVEALVPIGALAPHGGLAHKVVQRYLVDRGQPIAEPPAHEDRLVQPLQPVNVDAIHRFPDPEFLRLTGCSSWRKAISVEMLRGPNGVPSD